MQMTRSPDAVPGAAGGRSTPGLGIRPRPVAMLAAALMLLAGCTGGANQAPGADLVVSRAVRIPPGSAHTSFQGGRAVAATSRLDPYCELEVQQVSRPGAIQRVEPGRYRVTGQRTTLLKDPTTRLPALITGFDCSSDPLFQESYWRLAPGPGGDLHSLRCILPLYFCRMAPPLGLGAVAGITGGTIEAVVDPVIDPGPAR